MNLCPHCGAHFGEVGVESVLPANCPSCNRTLGTPKSAWATGFSPIQKYFRNVWEILTEPTLFFRRLPAEGGVGAPLAFALITHWIGAAIQFLWTALIGGVVGRYLTGLFHMAGDVVSDVDNPGRGAMLMQMQDRVTHWMWGAGSVIIDPFLTLFSILFTCFFVFIAARLFLTPGKNGAPREITFESALRIVCYGKAPAILAALPFAGIFISRIFILVVTVVGVREVYRTTPGRASAVVLFPYLLFLGIIILGLFLAAVAIFKVVATLF